MKRAMTIRVNGRIKLRSVRLIDHDGTLLGVVPFAEALARARELGLDLVEVNPRAKPPVCRILDFSRYRFLFVCLHNSARSQMAAALFARATKKHVVDSAGTHAADSIHPLVVEVMREVGIDLAGRRPRQLDPLLVGCADVIVRCLAPDPDDYPWGDCTARFVDWELPMPADEDHPTLEEIRALRDAIDARARALAAALGS